MGNDVQKWSSRRWEHPLLIGNFRRRSKQLTQLETDARDYIEDLPLIQGYLYWLQSSAQWQRRWCVLKGNVLYRLATSSSDDVIDNFKLDVWAVKRWDSGTLHGRRFCCELIYDEFCSEFFSTDSEGELLIWLNRLERVTDGPVETTSAGLARRKTVTGSTQSLHTTVRRVHSADSPYVQQQQQQQQLDRDRLWLQKQQLLEEVLRQKAALERQQRKTLLARSYQKHPRQDTPSDTSSNGETAADTDVLWHLRMTRTATKLKINDLERHLEACQEKTKYDMFNHDKPMTETSLIDEIDAVMTTDDLYRRLAELKLELTETERDLRAFHYKALRNGESMFFSQGNLHNYGVSKIVGCRCVYGICDREREVQETRCNQSRRFAKSCTNLAEASIPRAVIDAGSPHDDGVQHKPRQRLTRTGHVPRRAYSLRDTYTPKPVPCIAGPTVSSGITRKPSFPLAKTAVRRYDSDSAYIVTKNNQYPVYCSAPNGDVQRCRLPQDQELVTSTPVTRPGLRPRINGHAPLRRLADPPGSSTLSHVNYRAISPGIIQKNEPGDKQTTLKQNDKEREFCTKGEARHRRQDSDTRNDTITTYDSGVGTLSDTQDIRVEGQVRRRHVTADAPQTSWLRRRSASITGHLGVLPSKLKAFMPGKTQVDETRRWTSCDSPLMSTTIAARVGEVNIEALSDKYRLRRETGRLCAGGENPKIVSRGDFLRRQNAVEDEQNSNKGNCVDAVMLRSDVTRQHRAAPPTESGGRDSDVSKYCVAPNRGFSLQRSASGCDVAKTNTSGSHSIRRYNTVNNADFASVANNDTSVGRVTRNVATPWRKAVDTRPRASVCDQCGTIVSSDFERVPMSRCCGDAKETTTSEISEEALAHIAAFEKLIDDQLGRMSAARL